MKQTYRFEKYWAWIVGVLVAAFTVWFVAVEFEGLARFGALLLDAILVVPQSVANVVTYYTGGATAPVVGSLSIGAVFGALSTALLLLSARGALRLPVLTGLTLVVGLITGVLVFALGLPLVYAVGVGFGAGFFAGLAEQTDFMRSPGDFFQRMFDKGGMITFGRGVLIGGLAGGFGSQILTYTTQHCTFEADAEAVVEQIGVVITLISALLVLLPVWSILLRSNRRRDDGTAGYFRGFGLPIAFLLPSLISLIAFLYYPAVQIATLSLRAQRFRQERFVCLGNYQSLAEDIIYRNSFLITFALTVAIVLFSMTLALAIALLASQNVRGASVYRTLLIWPYALSPVVTGAIFLTLFRHGQTGLVNYALSQTLGISPNWFTDPSLAPWIVVFASVWNALGFNILFYIAGLQNVPKDLLEAAQIDGANRVQRFVRVTFPLLSPFTFFLLVTNVTYSFYGIYGAVDTLTQGGPPLGVGGSEGGATEVLIYKLYEDAFAPGAQVGFAAAQSVVLFLLVALITLVQFRYLERRVVYAD